MKRFRLSTLMLLVVIAGMSLALFLQARSAERRGAELTTHVQRLTDQLNFRGKERVKLFMEIDSLKRDLDDLKRPLAEVGKNGDAK